jgi:hypothetical protein
MVYASSKMIFEIIAGSRYTYFESNLITQPDNRLIITIFVDIVILLAITKERKI